MWNSWNSCRQPLLPVSENAQLRSPPDRGVDLKHKTLTIKGVKETVAGEGNRIDVCFDVAGQRYDVFFQSEDCRLRPCSEAFIALALLPAMRTHCAEIVCANPVTESFVANLEKIQDIFLSWWPQLGRVLVAAPSRTISDTASEGSRVASFFSLGLDSFYTFLKERERVSDLVFIQGFEVSLAKPSHRESVIKGVEQVASEYGKNRIQVETNFRILLDRYVAWPKSHGAALACIGLLLPNDFSSALISSTHSLMDPVPWGSHPAVDALWSLPDRAIVHYGADSIRVDKLRLVLSHEIVLKTLRVCWQEKAEADDYMNCGKCEKCIRTMVDLRAAGAPPPYPSFAEQLDLTRVRNLVLPRYGERVFFEESLRRLEENGVEEDLQDAIRTALSDRGILKKGRLLAARLAPHVDGARERLRHLFR